MSKREYVLGKIINIKKQDIGCETDYQHEYQFQEDLQGNFKTSNNINDLNNNDDKKFNTLFTYDDDELVHIEDFHQ